MVLSLDELLEKGGVLLAQLRASTLKRADILSALAKRAGVDADAVAIAVWETEW